MSSRIVPIECFHVSHDSVTLRVLRPNGEEVLTIEPRYGSQVSYHETWHGAVAHLRAMSGDALRRARRLHEAAVLFSRSVQALKPPG